MSRSSHQKVSYKNSSYGYIDEVNEGTSARTRPLSFDEIMLKRERKKLPEEVKEGARNARKVLLKSTIEVVSGHRLGDRSRDSSLGDHKTAVKDVQMAGSRKKEGKSRKEDRSENGKGVGRETETAMKYKFVKDVHRKTEPGGRENVRDKVDERSRIRSEHIYEKKHFVGPRSVDTYIDKSRTSDGRSKRKERTEDVQKHRELHTVKKHDSEGRNDPESINRKTKIESPFSHREEAKLKRRRSRSVELVKDRYRRSSSLSPREHEYVTRGHEREEVSLHSYKHRSGKHHSDVERNRISSNGSDSHYQRHGGSSSRLGGYSPRKRKTDAAVKTPPPVHSPERKSAAWDLAPVGVEGPVVSSTLFGPQLSLQNKSSSVVDSGVVPVASNVAKSFLALASNNLSFIKNASIDSIQLTQATRPMRRLYIENVPSSASEKDIMECLNNFLLSSGSNHIQGTRPCISCMIHREKGQALVEFLTPEDATAALAFDGRTFSGYALKIRRPKDFVDVTTGSSEKPKLGAQSIASHSISDIIKDSPHKIFIGGISEALSSEMLMEIVTVFGPLKSYHFEMNKLINEPCAFLEYADQSVTLKACAGLNGMKIGGRILTVAQAVPDAISVEDLQHLPSYMIPEHVKPLLQEPSPVLMIKNVLDPEAIKSLSEAELDEILEDIRLECARFGSVKSINVIKTICPFTPEPHDIIDNAGSCEIPVQLIEDDNQDAGGHIAMRSLENVEEHSMDDNIATANTNPVIVNVSHYVKDQNLRITVGQRVGDHDEKPQLTTGDTISGNRPQLTEASNQESMGINLLGSYRTGAINSGVENNPVANAAQRQDEVTDEVLEGAKTSDTEGNVNAEDVPDVVDVFNPGSVMVQFRRSEASCMAAHCLHGRVFDGRVVAIEYVPLNLYQSRFPR